MTAKPIVFRPLPGNVIPHHYELSLKLDLGNFKFEGKQSIYVKVNLTTDTVVLNAVDLDVKNVSFHDEDGQYVNAEECKINNDEELLTIKFPKNLLSGKTGRIHMRFQGIINDSMKGLYRFKSTSPEGESKYAAVTQFAAIDARRCFPCWDEPIYKATFDLTVTAPTSLTILSNMPVKHKQIQDNLTTINFNTTPRMSTYLLALVVGNFDYVESKIENSLVIRVYTPKGKSNQGEFALEVATKSLSYYNQYFKLPYPLIKLDCIAIADMSYSAMENWGLVTFRETAILCDQQNTSSANKQDIGLTVAHELAHQWFGNLVTMTWWTDLWLNEGYATFTSYVCLGHLYPELDIWQQFLTDVLCPAVDLDSLKNSHPIEVFINHPDEINSIFDDITYNKAASVIRMLYFWLHKEDFMKGMNYYLKENSYANADTAILWRALENASNKPVSKVMPTWTRQTGYPLLSVETLDVDLDSSSDKQDKQSESTHEVDHRRSCKVNRVLIISQQRFGSLEDSDTLWTVPIQVATSDNFSTTAVLLEEKKTEFSIDLPENSWVFINPGKIGFYRTKYSWDLTQDLLGAIKDKSLPILNRYSFLDDLFNCAKVGHTYTLDVLNVLKFYQQENEYVVWKCIDTCLSSIESLVSHLPFHENFKIFCRGYFTIISQKFGWDAKPEELHLDTLLRSLILNRMVMLGDEATVKEAKRRFDLHLSGTSIIPADLRTCVYRAVINTGDESTLEKMLELHEKVQLQEEKRRIWSSLGMVKDTQLLKKVLDYGFSDHIRAQDMIYVFQSTSWSAESRDFTWKFVKDNWEKLNDKIQTVHLVSKMVKWTTEDFVTEEMALDVDKFFVLNFNPAIDRVVKQAVEKIRINAEWLKRDRVAIETSLVELEFPPCRRNSHSE